MKKEQIVKITAAGIGGIMVVTLLATNPIKIIIVGVCAALYFFSDKIFNG